MIPYYLKNHLQNIKEEEDRMTAILSSSAGHTDLEIFYYGQLIKHNGTPFITDGALPCLIVAKDPISGETFTVFDGAVHGYDAMFCNECADAADLPLVKYEKYSGEVRIRLGYSIDYEEEKECYDFTEDKVELMYGSMDWEEAKSIGFDWISLQFVNPKKEFFEMELA